MYAVTKMALITGRRVKWRRSRPGGWRPVWSLPRMRGAMTGLTKSSAAKSAPESARSPKELASLRTLLWPQVYSACDLRKGWTSLSLGHSICTMGTIREVPYRKYESRQFGAEAFVPAQSIHQRTIYALLKVCVCSCVILSTGNTKEMWTNTHS